MHTVKAQNFGTFSPELLTEIFQKLSDAKDLLTVQKVCRTFACILNQPIFSNKIFMHFLHMSNLKAIESNDEKKKYDTIYHLSNFAILNFLTNHYDYLEILQKIEKLLDFDAVDFRHIDSILRFYNVYCLKYPLDEECQQHLTFLLENRMGTAINWRHLIQTISY